MSATVFTNMLGVTMKSVVGAEGDERMEFEAEDGRRFVFWYEHDCCAVCNIEDIAGDLSDLVGSPILQAEEVDNEPEPTLDYVPESFTWTFYKFATVKGSVTVRWFGESNGYYSESVSFEELPR